MSLLTLLGDIEHVIAVYEGEIGVTAARTRQMIERYGAIEALSKLAESADLQKGFRILRDRDQLDSTVHRAPVPSVYGGNGINGYHNSFMFEEPRIVLGLVGVYCGIVHLTRARAWVTDNALYVHTFIQPVDTTYLVAALKTANLNQYAGRSA